MVAAAAQPQPTSTQPTSVITAIGIDPGLQNTGIAVVSRLAWPSGQVTYVSRGVRMSRADPHKDKVSSRVRAAQDDIRRILLHADAVAECVALFRPPLTPPADWPELHLMAIENYAVYEPKEIAAMRTASQGLAGWMPDVRTDPQLSGFVSGGPQALAELARRVGQLQEALRAPQRGGIGLGQAAKTIAVYGACLDVARVAGIPVFGQQPSDLKMRFGKHQGASKVEVQRGVEAEVQGLAADIQTKVPQKTLKEHCADAASHAVLGADEFARMRLDVRVR